MKAIVSLLLAVLTVAGCSTNQQNTSPTVDADAERDAAQETICAFFDAYVAVHLRGK
jgi:uncharacterized lipoprotein